MPMTKPTSEQVTFLQSGIDAEPTTVQAKLRETVSVLDFGADPTGGTDSAAAIQAAIDSLATTGGVVHFPPGEYRIARNIGVNDRWGIKVTNSNITLKGDQAFLRRFNTDIVSDANAYPILFVGVPDSDVAPLTKNFVVDSLGFIGENTRHNVVGSSLTDFRNAIEFKNTSDTWVKDCVFTAIDSQAIQYQFPASYDYANAQYYNLTKNYRSKISGCSFIATPHAVAGRALLHCIVVAGVDFCHITNNYFEWCDDCVAGETTYNRYADTENDTFTLTGGAAALGPLKRSGRNIVVSNNTVLNSSEHAFYPALMDVTITGNNIRTDAPAICTGDQIKIRSRNVTCSGNTLSNFTQCIVVSPPSAQVSISGNICQSRGMAFGAVIAVSANGLSSYISNRPFFYVGGSPDYQPMTNISVSSNTVLMPDTAAVSNTADAAFGISTDISDANYANGGQLQNLTYTGNSVRGHNVGVYLVNSLTSVINISGNSFYAKNFTKSGFTSGTTLNTRAVLLSLVGGSGTTAQLPIMFSGNYVEGSEYLFTTSTGAASAGTYFIPRGITGNRFNYIKNIKTADVRGIVAQEMFTGNTGTFFLDRTAQTWGTNNSLDDGTTANSAYRYCFQWTGSALRFYTDDAGTFITL